MKTYKVVFNNNCKDLKVTATKFVLDMQEGFIYFYQDDETIPVAIVNSSMVASIKEE